MVAASCHSAEVDGASELGLKPFVSSKKTAASAAAAVAAVPSLSGVHEQADAKLLHDSIRGSNNWKFFKTVQCKVDNTSSSLKKKKLLMLGHNYASLPSALLGFLSLTIFTAVLLQLLLSLALLKLLP